MSTINEISILREFKSPRFINKNFWPLLLRIDTNLKEANNVKLKHAPIFNEYLYTYKIKIMRLHVTQLQITITLSL